MHSAFAPQSHRIIRPPAVGSSGPMAARRMPRIRFTSSVAPASSAPVEPAETKASPAPSRSSVIPTVREESFVFLNAVAGSSEISTTSDASRISTPERSVVSPLDSITFRISAARPTSRMSTPCSFRAASAPCTTASGALSPPIASMIIFILSIFPLLFSSGQTVDPESSMPVWKLPRSSPVCPGRAVPAAEAGRN